MALFTNAHTNARLWTGVKLPFHYYLNGRSIIKGMVGRYGRFMITILWCRWNVHSFIEHAGEMFDTTSTGHHIMKKCGVQVCLRCCLV